MTNYKHLKCVVTLFLTWFFLTAGFVNVYEKNEEAEADLVAVVSSVHENYIALAYLNNVKGVEQEIGFKRGTDIQLIHKHRWDQIRSGEEVLARYIEIRRVREGRKESGELGRESFIVERRLKSLTFNEPEKRQLISGV